MSCSAVPHPLRDASLTWFSRVVTMIANDEAVTSVCISACMSTALWSSGTQAASLTTPAKVSGPLDSESSKAPATSLPRQPLPEHRGACAQLWMPSSRLPCSCPKQLPALLWTSDLVRACHCDPEDAPEQGSLTVRLPAMHLVNEWSQNEPAGP